MPIYNNESTTSSVPYNLGALVKDIYLDVSNGLTQTGVFDPNWAYATFSLTELPTAGDQFTLTDWNNQNPAVTFTYVASPSIEPTDISLTNLDAEALTLPQMLNSTLNAITAVGWYILPPTEGDTSFMIQQKDQGPLGNQENGTTNGTAITVSNFDGGGVVNLYAPIHGEYGQNLT